VGCSCLIVKLEVNYDSVYPNKVLNLAHEWCQVN
jgi:hypothetical protein